MEELKNKKEIESSFTSTPLRKTLNTRIQITEHHRYKDEIVLYWMVEDIDKEFSKTNFIRLNKKEIPKLMRALKKFID